MPGTASAAIRARNLPFSDPGSKTTPGSFTQTLTGQCGKVPAAVTATDWPRGPPAGKRRSITGPPALAREDDMTIYRPMDTRSRRRRTMVWGSWGRGWQWLSREWPTLKFVNPSIPRSGSDR